jgi:hypothetical protein
MGGSPARKADRSASSHSIRLDRIGLPTTKKHRPQLTAADGANDGRTASTIRLFSKNQSPTAYFFMQE